MRHLPLALAAIIALAPLLHADEGGAPPPPPSLTQRFARKLENVKGIVYAAEVASGLYRGAQPTTDEGVAYLKSLGIKTVINLRHFHGDDEGRAVEAAGMRYERIPLESSAAPTAESVQRFMALVTDPALRPVYVHCQHGVDRTGTMMAVYRMEVDGWSNADAAAEMEHFGAHSLWRDLRAFVAKYAPRGLWKKKATK